MVKFDLVLVVVLILSMIFAIFPILLYLTVTKAKIWLSITLFSIYCIAFFDHYNRRLETDGWYQEEEMRQLTVLAVILIATMIFGLHKRFLLKNQFPKKSSNSV